MALPHGTWRRANPRAFPRAPWPSILLRQGYGGQGRSAIPHQANDSPRARRRARRRALPSRWRTFPPGHDGGEGARRPTSRRCVSPRAYWPSIYLCQGYGGQGCSALLHQANDFPRARRRLRARRPTSRRHTFPQAHWPSRRSALPHQANDSPRSRRWPW